MIIEGAGTLSPFLKACLVLAFFALPLDATPFFFAHTLVLALSQIGMVPRFEHLINVVVKMSSAVFVTVGESHIVLSRLNY